MDVQPFSIQAALKIISNVADAIGYAHAQGIIHCDLKPGNILQDKQGNVRVTDFGFAFLIAGDAATSGNHIGGTRGFIAPEILRGLNLPAPTTDIYSLGALLWNLVTGRLPEKPFTHHSGKKEQKAVARIVSRCLFDDPRERYQTITELQQALMALE
ncbi:MAG: serine/threonine protein kinase [Planctomycetaceae bacterium]|nr:serine/threonine protein kinase [Planctomycetaceae bacterium]